MKSLLDSLFSNLGSKILVLILSPIILLGVASIVGNLTLLDVQQESSAALLAVQNDQAETNKELVQINYTIAGVARDAAKLVSDHQVALLFKNANASTKIKEDREKLASDIEGVSGLLANFGKRLEQQGLINSDPEKALSKEKGMHKLNYDTRVHVFKALRLGTALKNVYSIFAESNKRTVDLLVGAQYDAAAANFRFEEASRVASLNEALTDLSNSLVQFNAGLLEYSSKSQMGIMEDGSHEMNNYVGLAVVVLVLVALAAAIIGWFASRAMITRPITEQVVVIEALTSGNTDVVMPAEGRDELGSLTRGLKLFRDSIVEQEKLRKDAEIAREAERHRKEREAAAERERLDQERAREAQEAKLREERTTRMEEIINSFRGHIEGAVANLERSSADMQITAQDMVTVAEQTGGRADKVNKASYEMQGSMKSVAAAVEQYTSSINEVNQQIRTANVISQETVHAGEGGRQSVSSLQTASNQIEAVVQLINEIAEQTNLLALNATIEAARAGEAGKGFAVVASEVKSLANQTAQATDSISKQINEMQSTTQGAVSAIEGIIAKVSNLNAVMTSISAAMEEQQAATMEIKRGVDFTSDGIGGVVQDVQDVSAGAQRSSESSNTMRTASEQLNRLSQEIKSEVDSFLSNVRSI